MTPNPKQWEIGYPDLLTKRFRFEFGALGFRICYHFGI